MELFGGERNATIHAHAQEVTLRQAGDREATSAELPPVRSTTGDLKVAFNSFLQAIVDDTTPPVGIEDGIRVTRMIEAALESVRTGQAVVLDKLSQA